MEPKKENLPLGVNQQAGLSESNADKSNKKIRRVKPGTKEHVILSAFVSGKSLNRFEAIKLHDTALNSTVSTLQGKGIQIHRERETVPCVNGTKHVDVCRYRILPDEMVKARQLLVVEA